MDTYRALMIGEKAPDFQANTTYGMIHFPGDYNGKWVVFFSHPGDLAQVAAKTNFSYNRPVPRRRRDGDGPYWSVQYS